LPGPSFVYLHCFRRRDHDRDQCRRQLELVHGSCRRHRGDCGTSRCSSPSRTSSDRRRRAALLCPATVRAPLQASALLFHRPSTFGRQPGRWRWSVDDAGAHYLSRIRQPDTRSRCCSSDAHLHWLSRAQIRLIPRLLGLMCVAGAC
jgi:hypothetical protein